MKPTQVEILGVPIKISYFDDEECDTFGFYFPQTQEIKLKIDKNYRSTLLHEIIHAVFDIAGITNLVSGKVEETIVSALEMGLKDLVKLNTSSKKFKRQNNP